MRTRRGTISSGRHETRNWFQMVDLNQGAAFCYGYNAIETYVGGFGSNLLSRSQGSTSWANANMGNYLISGPNGRLGLKFDSSELAGVEGDFDGLPWNNGTGFSIEFFFKIPPGGTSSSANVVLGQVFGGSSSSFSQAEQNGTLYCSGGSVSYSASGLDDGQWHHFFRSHNSTSMNEFIAIDGHLVYSGYSYRSSYTQYNLRVGYPSFSGPISVTKTMVSSVAVYGRYIQPQMGFIRSLSKAYGPVMSGWVTSSTGSIFTIGGSFMSPGTITVDGSSIPGISNLQYIDYMDLVITPVADGGSMSKGIMVQTPGYVGIPYWSYSGSLSFYSNNSGRAECGVGLTSYGTVGSGFNVSDGPQTIRLKALGRRESLSFYCSEILSGGLGGGTYPEYSISLNTKWAAKWQ